MIAILAIACILNKPNVSVENFGNGSFIYSYQVEAVGVKTASPPSNTVNVSNFELSNSQYNVLSWSSVAGATSYKVYRTFNDWNTKDIGLIGKTKATTYIDDNSLTKGKKRINCE